MSSRLEPLQRDFLQAFFQVSGDFYLTGGGALIGFHGWLRDTKDLDLFSTHQDALAHVDAAVQKASAAIGAAAEQVRSTPYFCRYVVRRGEATVQVDLVHEPSPQAHPAKIHQDGIQVDVPEEIFASKICTLVHRVEPRDFWDVYEFVVRGYSLDQALADASVKEGGIDAESLLYVLSDIDWNILRVAAERAGLPHFARVEAFFQALIPDLSLRLLPP